MPHCLATVQPMIDAYLGGLTRKQVAERFAVSPHSIDTIFRRFKVRLDPKEAARRVVTQPSIPRPVPADFAQVAPTMLTKDLAKHYRTGPEKITRWLRETGAQSLGQLNRCRPMPEGFTEIARTMTRAALGKHFVAGDDAVVRWLAEAGISAKAHDPRVNYTASTSSIRNIGRWITPGIHDQQWGPCDEAARILRAYFAVYRCDERGRQDEKGNHWRVGNVVCTPDELLARADRYRSKAA